MVYNGNILMAVSAAHVTHGPNPLPPTSQTRATELLGSYALFTTLKIKARSVNLKIACVIHMDMHVHELLNPRGL